MKTLVSNEAAHRYGCSFSKVVESENGKKFKITHDTGNCYSHTYIYVMLPDFSWSEVANTFDIGCGGINYVSDEERKKTEMKAIYNKAIAYIKAVFL